MGTKYWHLDGLNLYYLFSPPSFQQNWSSCILFLSLYVTFEQGNTTGCPREPWHDLHSKIDGPAAYDVLTNFEQRWLRASKAHGIKKLKMPSDDALLIIDRLPDIVGISDVPCVRDDDPESWHVQVIITLVYLCFRISTCLKRTKTFSTRYFGLSIPVL